MHCSRVQTIIDEVGDLDRLPADAARHVAACEGCERFGRDLVALRALLREPGRVVAPADFDMRLARRLRRARETAPRRAVWAFLATPSQGLAATAALGLLVAGSVAVLRVVTPTDVSSSKPVAASGPLVDTTDSNVSRPGNIASIVSPTPPSAVGLPPRPQALKVNLTRSAPRRAVDVARPLASGAMILVHDEIGTRVVSVPTVLVGAERAIPTTVDAPAEGASVAF